MVSKKREHSDIFLRDLHLLQYAILVPKLTNIVEVKKHLGIPLSEAEIRNELKNPHSRLFKYMNDMITTCLILIEIEKEIVNLQQQHEHLVEQHRKMQAVEEELSSASTSDRLFLEEKQQYEKKLLELTMVANLEARKFEELKFWAKFFNEDFQKIIDDRYDMINHNLNRFNNLLAQDLPPEQREKVQELFERYLRHLELSSEENKQKYIGEYLKDEDTAKQVVKKDFMLEQMYKVLANNVLEEDIYKKFGLSEIDEKNKQKITQREYNDSTQSMSKYDKTNNNKWRYLQLADVLNNKLEKFFHSDPKTIIISFEKITQLLDKLHLLKEKRDEESQQAVDSHVSDTLQSLLSHEPNIDITKYLREWIDVSQTNAAKLDKKLNFNEHIRDYRKEQTKEELTDTAIQENREVLQILDQAKEVLSQEASLLDSIATSFQRITNNVDVDKEKEINNIIDSFNELSKKYPDEPKVVDIYKKLSSLSFIDKDKMLQPIESSGPDFGL